MIKVLANDGISQSGIDKLENAGFSVTTEKVPQDQLIDAINREDYKVLLVRSATKVKEDVIDGCPNLKFIGRGGVGMDNIAVEYARGKNIFVTNTPAASSQSVAELVMAHMFSLARMTYDSNRQMPEKGSTDFKALKKSYGKGLELRNRTLGIIGFGRIGRFLAQYALGAGMKVLAYDAFDVDTRVKLSIQGHSDEVEVEVPQVSLEELLSKSQFVSLHVPKQEDGSAVIGSSEIKSMVDGAMLINASRGGVVDEDALLEGLNSGKLAGAALDVFENEPTPREDLLKHDKIALSPHIGAATTEAQDRIGLELADLIIGELG